MGAVIDTFTASSRGFIKKLESIFCKDQFNSELKKKIEIWEKFVLLKFLLEGLQEGKKKTLEVTNNNFTKLQFSLWVFRIRIC